MSSLPALNLSPLPTTTTSNSSKQGQINDYNFLKYLKSFESFLDEKSATSGSPSNRITFGNGNGIEKDSNIKIPSSHELILLQQELSRLNHACSIIISSIKENSSVLQDWLASSSGSNAHINSQINGTVGGKPSSTIVSSSTSLPPGVDGIEINSDAVKQKKVKVKVKDEGGPGSVIKLLDLDDSMDVDQPGSIGASSADELEDTSGLRASVKTGNGGQVSISNQGRIKMSVTPHLGTTSGKSGSHTPSAKASKKGDSKNKLKQSRIKKRSITERDIISISGAAPSSNSRMTPDIPEPTNSPGEGDYSHIKGLPPNQIPIATFWTFMEQYFRNLVPEDLHALSSKGDEVTPFMIPPLGKHYLLQWKEEDRRLLSLFNDGVTNPSVATNKEYAEVDDCVFEGDIHLGPLSDRLLASFIREGLVVPDQMNDPSLNNAFGGDEDGPKGGSIRNVPRIRSKTDISLFEERLKEELVHIGLLEGEEEGGIAGSMYGDTLEGENDILRLLKSTQDLLRVQMDANYIKKRKILEITEEYMAYQEYNTLVDDINKTVDTAYTKRFKSAVKNPKSKKEKSKFPVSNAPSFSSRGFSNETIVQILDSRKRLIEEVGNKFFPMEKHYPPTRSIFDDYH